MLLAWVFLQNPGWLNSRSNNGRLIIPVVSTDYQQWIGIDDFSLKHIDELKGHWVLLNLIPGKECAKVCRDALHKTKQIRLMLNKDLTRLRRAAVTLQAVDAQKVKTWWQDDTRLLRISVDAQLLNQINASIDKPLQDGVIIVMDPLGNLMMVYDAGFDPYLIKKDLTKLLRASQIG
jgi:hypothetical protein